MSEDIDAKAEALLLQMTRARRRAKPRVAEALYDAEDREIETPFGTVQAWRLGEGPAVLLVHGWEDDNALWGPIIDAFADIGRAVVAFDLPGHGYSQAEEATIESARAAIRAVAEEMGPIESLMAHSFGCAASTAAMSDGLEVRRCVLIATPIPDEDGVRRRYAEVKDATPELFARAAALYEERNGKSLHNFRYLEAAARMKAPALFVHSVDDEKTPAENSQRIAEIWPQADTLIMDGLGHRLLVQDEEVVASMVAFIES